MPNLNEIVQSAQGGAMVDNLAAKFGVSPQQAQAVIQAALPTISAALQQPGALGTLVQGMLHGSHQASYQDPAAAQSGAAVQNGGAALNNMFGSSNVTAQVAQSIAARSGLSPQLIQQMLPVIASVVLGGLYHTMQTQGFGGILGQLGSVLGGQTAGAQAGASPAGQPAPSGGGLAGMLGGILSSFLGGSTQAATANTAGTPQGNVSPGLEALEKMLQPGIQLAVQHQAEIQNILGQIIAARR